MKAKGDPRAPAQVVWAECPSRNGRASHVPIVERIWRPRKDRPADRRLARRWSERSELIRIMHRDDIGGTKEAAKRYPEWTGWPEFNPCL